jgi:hypothetical protein
VNKTSRNSVLFMTNIGTTRGSVAYLIKVLLTIADELEARNNALNPAEKQLHIARIRSLTQEPRPCPISAASTTHFRAVPGVPGGDLRKAYFLAYSEANCEYVKLAGMPAVHGAKGRAGLGQLRDPLSAGLPRAGAGPSGEQGDLGLLDRLGREGDPRLPERTGPARVQRPRLGAATHRHGHGRYEGGIDQWSGGKRSRWPFFARPWS